MNREQRVEVLRDARAELAEAREQLALLNRRVLQLTQVVRGLAGLLDEDEYSVDAELVVEPIDTETAARWGRYVTLESPRGEGRPTRPRDAVMQVLTLRPDVAMAPKEVVDLVRRAGLFNPHLKSGSNGYTTALNRLADEPGSGVERADEGQYIFRPERRGISASLSGEGTLFTGGSVSE